jgi:hypothetical protein
MPTHDGPTPTDEVADLRAEVQRLRDLVGPEELSYTALKLELWTVRDLFIGMDAELGNVRAHSRSLDRDVEVLRRELHQTRDTSAPVVAGGLNSAIRDKARTLRDRLT